MGQTPVDMSTWVQRIDAVLPQTQCTRCGYPDCRSYAEAIADGRADIDRCPPGGQEGVARLAAATGREVRPLDVRHGREGPRLLAVIDEAWCIGCTLCVKACPVDCIIGAPRQMHTVIADLCTGCELCVPPCPVDCIDMRPATPGRTGWDAWSEAQAHQSRDRHTARKHRLQRQQLENAARLEAKAASKLADLAAASSIQGEAALERKRTLVVAAVERARARASRAGGATGAAERTVTAPGHTT
jgi:electron transport complex protein RnfB